MNFKEASNAVRRPIILVYLGKRIPRYFIKNLNYLCEFQNRPIVLITDVSASRKLKIQERVRIVDANQFFDGWKTQSKSSYRGFFWDKTIKRLYVLFRFVEAEEILECIHIEGDVWVAPYANLDFELERNTCIYPSMSGNRGIGSIMFIENYRNKTSAELLRLMSTHSGLTDMQLLGSFFRLRPDIFKPLPSGPGIKSENQDLYDGAVLGMHLFGEHARNRFGFYRMFWDYPDLAIDWGKSQFEINSHSQLVLTYERKDYILNSLHLHSKNMKMFTKDWKRTLDSQLLYRKKMGQRITKFQLIGLAESMLDYVRLIGPYIKRKIFKLSHSVNREVKGKKGVS